MEGRKRSRSRLATRAAVAIAAAGLSLALAGSAAAETVTGGKSVLKPKRATFEGLADMSIGVEATGAAKFRRKGASFPVSGGEVQVNRPNPRGEITHRGGLAFFTEGGPGVKFSQFVVVMGPKKAQLYARSGRAEVHLFNLKGGKRILAGGPGEGLVALRGSKAKLAKEGARVLRKTFDFPFRRGIPFGKFSTRAFFGD